MPLTVAPEDRAQANAINRVGGNGAQIAGAAPGGAAVAALRPGWDLAVDAASFALATPLRVGMRFTAIRPSEPAGMVRELREGWRELGVYPGGLLDRLGDRWAGEDATVASIEAKPA